MSRHSDRARLALARLADADPALGALALWCDHRDGDGPTRTRGDTIFYGPEFPLLPIHEQIGLAGHHVLHVTLRHSARMAAMAARLGPAFDAKRFNRAADAIANDAILAAGHAVPRPCVTLASLLPKDAAVALSDWTVESLYLGMSAGPGGRDGDAAATARAPSGEGDLDPAPDGGSGDRAAPEWRAHATRAFETGRLAGRGIGRHAARIADLGTPGTAWETVLRGLVTRAVSEAPRRTHRRPARAWIAMEAEARRSGGPAPVFQPGTARGSDRPRVIVGLDTSGSVDEALLARFAAEIAGIARRTGAETRVLAFDETVHAEIPMGAGTWETAITSQPLRRGGGTSFIDVLARADALNASIAVILTDLDGAFGEPPRLPVLWAIPAPSAPDPPFGRVLLLGA